MSKLTNFFKLVGLDILGIFKDIFETLKSNPRHTNVVIGFVVLAFIIFGWTFTDGFYEGMTPENAAGLQDSVFGRAIASIILAFLAYVLSVVSVVSLGMIALVGYYIFTIGKTIFAYTNKTWKKSEIK